MMDRHLRDEEIQEVLDGDEVGRATLDHLHGCDRCGRTLERVRAALALLDRLETADPPRGLESRVLARLFPRPATVVPAFFRIPRWARAFAPALLLAGSAALVLSVRLMGVLGDVAVRWALHAEPGSIRLAAEGLSRVVLALLGAARDLVHWVDAARTVARAALLAGESPQFLVVALASAGFVAFLALGWGARLLLSRSKGGHHVLFV